MENKNNKNFFLNPSEMAIRKIYWTLFEKEIVSKVFRPGDRQCGAWRGYCENQEIIAKAIENVGADWAKIPPQFLPGKEKKIYISKVEVKKIGELSEEDFVGSSPDVHDVASLQYHLGVLYNLFPDEVGSDMSVTIFSFKYI